MNNSQSSLFENIADNWPEPDRFPTNAKAPGVAGIIGADLASSKRPLIITGFASLNRLVEWLAACQKRLNSDPTAHSYIRILIGHEPFPSNRKDFRSRSGSFSQQVIDYWAERGVSLHLSAQVLAALELVRHGPIEVRSSSQVAVHAKVYVGDAGLSLGSSNFTTSGLQRQIEANVRFTPAEKERWNEAIGLAEEIWNTGTDFRDGLIRLLERLLQCVTWQEALARACAELLEGSWAERLRERPLLGERFRLWPSQEKGIAHALWVLEHEGSVLVADATGSGKTLMGAHLVRRIMARLARTGRGRQEVAPLMCPPAVLPEWQNCASDCGAQIKTYSQGYLSQSSSDSSDQLRGAIRRAQVLVIDEAHNFLRKSKRTMALFSNIADHVVLFTATPVNRGPRDILAIIDLLGADNLDEQSLNVLTRLWKRRRRSTEDMSSDEAQQLRKAIRRFTVRRTKSDFNRMVDRDPDKYRLASGHVCRYPKHDARGYSCDEPLRDRKLAAEIRREASRLKGLTRLQSPFELTEALRRDGHTEQSYLNARVNGAAALAAHEVVAALRSSRVRLLEHLRGTKSVFAERKDLARDNVSEKNGVIETLSQIAGSPPKSRLQIPMVDWLQDPDAHLSACAAERATYERIESLVRELSDARENAKAKLLRELVKKHGLVLAFDSHLITLADLRLRLANGADKNDDYEIIVATGGDKGGRRKLFQSFKPGSDDRNLIALCSDALAEGVNLQAAPVVVMLDMPSVIRVAEQRIGRIDRMNSRHESIEAYWPEDPPEFALRSSERLVERHEFVTKNLGSNLALPRSLAGDVGDDVVRYQDYAREVDKEADSGNALQDVFESVRGLVEGNDALVPDRVYQEFRNSDARVLSSVSVVEADEAFAFVAVAGTEWGSPRWIYLSGDKSSPVTDLDEICDALRRKLTPHTKNRDLDGVAAGALRDVLIRLEMHEEALLPRGKQRALEQMRDVLKKYQRESSLDSERTTTIRDVLGLASGRYHGQAVDLAALADWWLETIQPVKVQHLLEKSRNRPVLLKDLRKDLLQNPLDTSTLKGALEATLVARSIDERVVAAIIGVKGNSRWTSERIDA